MQKFINEPKNITTEVLEGLVLANQELLCLEQGCLVVNKALAEAQRVSVVVLTDCGHEPGYAGFVGQGMVDIAVVGNVFTAPGPKACLEALQLADRGQGVLLVVPNHTGNVLTVNIAVKQAEKLGLKVAKLVVADDVAAAPRSAAGERRGMLGCVAVVKIAAAAAAQGKSLDQVAELAERAAANMASIAVATSGGTNPATGEALGSVASGVLAIGVGLDGEAAGASLPMKTAEEIAGLLMNALAKDLQLQPGEQVLLLVNGNGSTTLMEQLIVFRSCYGALAERGLTVVGSKVGNMLTLQEAAGLQLLVVRMDQELLACWNAPCKTAYFNM